MPMGLMAGSDDVFLTGAFLDFDFLRFSYARRLKYGGRKDDCSGPVVMFGTNLSMSSIARKPRHRIDRPVAGRSKLSPVARDQLHRKVNRCRPKPFACHNHDDVVEK